MGSGQDSDTYRKKLEIESNEKIAAQNLAFQKEKFQYDKDLQQQLFNREDTSYQRTVADMRSAGVSPLAMQGVDGAGEAIQTQAPHNDMVYDYMSGMSTDAEKFNNLLGAVGAISSLMQQTQQVRSLRLQNDFTERTLNDRVAHEQAQTILSRYSALDARDKRYFQNIFGVNEHMPRELQLANIASVLSMSDDDFNSRLTGSSLRDFESSDYDFYQMLNYGTYDKRLVRSLFRSFLSDITGSSSSNAGETINDVANGDDTSLFKRFNNWLKKNSQRFKGAQH